MKSTQRYNQGFGGFGPLEKCSTGKLVLAKDALAEISWLKTQLKLTEQDRSVYAGTVADLARELEAATCRAYWLAAMVIVEGMAVIMLIARLRGVQ